MFERFTDRARHVVVLAQEEATLLDHNYIGTEHVLLGLLREEEGIGARTLENLGISLDAVRREVEGIIGHGQAAPVGHIPFTPRAKKVLELSLREALQLGHNYIGTEHLLLGLVREGEGVAAQVLTKLGADLGRIRQGVIRLLTGYTGSVPVEPGRYEGLEPGAAIQTGPCCPTCKLPLEGALAYRSIMAERDDEKGDPIILTVGFCTRCGAAIGTSLG
jgi:ATP-dependent Clp protease ATP-binding subunit ClpC